MKTIFSILWVDDQPVFVDAIEMSLRSWLDDKGFELQVVRNVSIGLRQLLRKFNVALLTAAG